MRLTHRQGVEELAAESTRGQFFCYPPTQMQSAPVLVVHLMNMLLYKLE